MFLETVIEPKQPYRILLHLKTFSLPGMPTPCIFENNTCRRLSARNAWIVKVAEHDEKSVLFVKVYSGSISDAVNLIKRIYNVEFDYSVILDKAKKYPRVWMITNKYLGLRPALSATMWESLIKTIIMQNISLRMALRIIPRIVQHFGNKMIVNNIDFYDFPTPENLYRRSIGELKNCGLSRNKAEYIINLAQSVIEGAIDLESIARKEAKEAVNELTSIRGVGPWTAKLAFMAYTGYMGLDLFEDKSVQRAVSALGLDEQSLRKDFGEFIGLLLYLLSLDYENKRRK